MFKNLNRDGIEKFKLACEKGVILFDGAMGTQIQSKNPDPSLFKGCDGFNEYLNLTAPEIIEQIHVNYLSAGARAIETNTFGANAIVMAEYGIGEEKMVYEFSRKGAEVGKSAAVKFVASNPSVALSDIFVAGSIGPSTKLPSLGHMPFHEMVRAYAPQVEGLMDGGADLLIVETCQDILQVKSLLYAISDAFVKKGFMLPVMVSVTLQQNGSMLVGSDVQAVAAILENYGIVSSIGFNCALGPFEMEKHVETLARSTEKLVSSMPNAGLPENVDGKTVYRLTPDEFAAYLKRFVENYGVNIAGGCCGTGPGHIMKAAEVLAGIKPKKRERRVEAQVASLYSAWSMKQEPRPFIIGERTNANGSKAFRELLLKDDYDGMQSVAKGQQNGGAHAIDLSVAYVGRDEARDMAEAVKRFSTGVNLPLVIDSTDPKVIEAALSRHGGKCIINSINLEDGGRKLSEVVPLARKFGAALICLTIDEHGMAKTADKKLAIADRIYDICVNEHDIAPSDLIFDMLTFTIGSGDGTLRNAAVDTMEAIKEFKKRHPDCFTSLGISNISFGLKPAARGIINSAFLKHCIDSGLDMAIINPAGFLAFHKISAEDLEMAENLIFNRSVGGADPLLAFLKYIDAKAPDAAGAAGGKAGREKMSAEEILKSMVVDGEKKDLDRVLEKVMKDRKPLEIINGPLIEAMKKVGELFGSGVMQLPFVLQSAEVMKAAVSLLEPHMQKSEYLKLGKMVLATVSGDVHDIGKNLVDIILSNNGFDVINLGIKIPVEEMIAACEKHDANVLGMSGLLVRSTQIMRENLIELTRRGKAYDVILGGAALTRKYVEEDLAKVYGGRVFYAEDAFAGLTIMKSIVSGTARAAGVETPDAKRAVEEPGAVEILKPGVKIVECDNIPVPPFIGRKVMKGVNPALVFPLINRTTLIRGQWQYGRGNAPKEEYDSMISSKVEPLFADLLKRSVAENYFELDCVYGYYRCCRRGGAVVIFDPADDSRTIGEFIFPRQKFEGGLSISDFILPEGRPQKDIIGLAAVTVGKNITGKIAKLFEDDRYRDYLHLNGLSVEMAEAFTEYVHALMRTELGIIEKAQLDERGVVAQRYRGSRYGFGYPACPDLAQQKTLFDILNPGEIGITLTETMQMVPEHSTSAVVIHHPQAKYFTV